MVFEHRSEHASPWAAIVSIAAKIGCMAQTLSNSADLKFPILESTGMSTGI